MEEDLHTANQHMGGRSRSSAIRDLQTSPGGTPHARSAPANPETAGDTGATRSRSKDAPTLPAGAQTGTALVEMSVSFSRSGPPHTAHTATVPRGTQHGGTHPLTGAPPGGRQQTCDGPRVGRARVATGDWRTHKPTEEHVQTTESCLAGPRDIGDERLSTKRRCS